MILSNIFEVCKRFVANSETKNNEYSLSQPPGGGVCEKSVTTKRDPLSSNLKVFVFLSFVYS